MKTLFLQQQKTTISEDTIIIDDGMLQNAEIFVQAQCQVFYTFLPKEANNEKIFRHFLLGENVHFEGKSVIVENTKTEIIAEAVANGVNAHLDLLAIASNNAHISVEWIARVQNPHKNLNIRVDQTNILIGNTAVVRGVPRLEIATDDIEWGHSCKIHRLHGDALFYLESHGLSSENAEIFLLNSEIISHLSLVGEEHRETLCSEIHQSLYEKK